MQHEPIIGVKRPLADTTNAGSGACQAIDEKSSKADVEAWLKTFLSDAEVNEVVNGVAACGNELVGKYLLHLTEKNLHDDIGIRQQATRRKLYSHLLVLKEGAPAGCHLAGDHEAIDTRDKENIPPGDAVPQDTPGFMMQTPQVQDANKPRPSPLTRDTMTPLPMASMNTPASVAPTGPLPMNPPPPVFRSSASPPSAGLVPVPDANAAALAEPLIASAFEEVPEEEELPYDEAAEMNEAYEQAHEVIPPQTENIGTAAMASANQTVVLPATPMDTVGQPAEQPRPSEGEPAPEEMEAEEEAEPETQSRAALLSEVARILFEQPAPARRLELAWSTYKAKIGLRNIFLLMDVPTLRHAAEHLPYLTQDVFLKQVTRIDKVTREQRSHTYQMKEVHHMAAAIMSKLQPFAVTEQGVEEILDHFTTSPILEEMLQRYLTEANSTCPADVSDLVKAVMSLWRDGDIPDDAPPYFLLGTYTFRITSHHTIGRGVRRQGQASLLASYIHEKMITFPRGVDAEEVKQFLHHVAQLSPSQASVTYDILQLGAGTKYCVRIYIRMKTNNLEGDWADMVQGENGVIVRQSLSQDLVQILAVLDHLRDTPAIQKMKQMQAKIQEAIKDAEALGVPEAGTGTNGEMSITQWNAIAKFLEASTWEEPPAMGPQLEATLNLNLYPFQRQALSFMIHEEEGEGSFRHAFVEIPFSPGVEGTESFPIKCFYSPLLNEIIWSLSWVNMELAKTPASHVRGGYLCLEMGLGKTAVVIALALNRPPPMEWTCPDFSEALLDCTDKGYPGHLPKGKTLVIAPLSVLGQWQMEIEKFARCDEDHPMPRVCTFYKSTERTRNPGKLADYDIVLTTPGVARNESGPNGTLRNVEWYRIVLDEAHMDKEAVNVATTLPARNKWCLTGTPIGGNVDTDLKKLFGILHLPSPQALMRKPRHVAALLRPLMCRYTRNGQLFGEPVLQLPGTQERVVEVQMDGEEAMYYAALEASQRSALQEYKDSIAANLEDRARREAAGEIVPFKADQHIVAGVKLLQLLAPCRKACSGGSVISLTSPPAGTQAWAATRQAEEALQQWRARVAARKQTLQQLVAHFGEFHEAVMTEAMSVEQEEAELAEHPLPNTTATWSFSKKLEALVSELSKLRETDATAKVLVFTASPEALVALKPLLIAQGFQYRSIEGGMSLAQRQEALQAFQTDPPTTIFLLSSRAAACGLTLTSASHVYLLEPALNPSVEAQAIGRCVRMGQTKEVVVNRMIVANSVEQRIRNLVLRRSADGAQEQPCATEFKPGAFNVSNPHEDSIASQSRTEEIEALFG